jgi:RNA polymerase sigma-70 factor (ECF subfamily)
VGPEEIEALRSGLQIMALRALGDREAADEAAQETLVRAFQALNAGRLDDCRNLGAFVRGIARNVIVDAQRRLARHVALEVVPSSETRADLEDPLGSLISEEETSRLRQSLAQLSPEDRDILHLSFFEGMSPSEIAASRGEPAYRIRKRKSRALRRLRTAFSDRELPFREPEASTLGSQTEGG